MSANTFITDFYNKNKALVVFLILTLIVSAVLIVLCAHACNEINTSVDEIKKISEDVKKLNAEGAEGDRNNPKIVGENARLIKEDAAKLSAKTLELQRVCGQGYDSCFIEAFCQGKPEELDVYLNAFKKVTAKKDYSIAEYVENPSYEKLAAIFDEVCKEVAGNKTALKNFDDAFNAFKAKLANVTKEDLRQFEGDPKSGNDLPAKAIFLQVLGLPRTIDKDKYLQYRGRLMNDFINAYAAEGAKCVAVTELERMMKYQRKEETGRGPVVQLTESSPVQANVIHLCKLFQIYEQILRNVQAVRGDKNELMLIQCAPVGNLEFGYEDKGKGYHSYRMEVTVRGTLSDVRDFVNKLHNAYKQNHVFSMHNFSLKSYVPEKTAKKDVEIKLNEEIFRHVFAYSTILNDMIVKEETPDASGDKTSDNSREGVVQEEVTSRKILIPYDNTKDKHYGAMLLGFGHDKWVVASMTVDYIIFNPAITDAKKATKSKK